MQIDTPKTIKELTTPDENGEYPRFPFAKLVEIVEKGSGQTSERVIQVLERWDLNEGNPKSFSLAIHKNIPFRRAVCEILVHSPSIYRKPESIPLLVPNRPKKLEAETFLESRGITHFSEIDGYFWGRASNKIVQKMEQHLAQGILLILADEAASKELERPPKQYSQPLTEERIIEIGRTLLFSPITSSPQIELKRLGEEWRYVAISLMGQLRQMKLEQDQMSKSYPN